MSEAAPPPAAPAARRTAPAGIALSMLATLRASIVGVVAFAFGLREVGPIPALAIGIALMLVISAVIAVVGWRRQTYTVGADEIRVDSGIFSRTARVVPYARIQDVGLEQGPLARVLGLAEVSFDTGAGGSDELALAYLTVAEGEALRDLVRARRQASAAAPAATDMPDPVLFAMTPRRVATFGLFEFSLAFIAVLAGATQQFDFLLPFDIWELDEWRALLAGPGAQLAGLGLIAQAIGAAIALLLLIAVGVLAGLIRTILREWGFTLERTARGLRRRRGLLTRTDVVLPTRRVQAMRVETGLIRRRFGWHGLSFVSLAQDSGGSGDHAVAPFATREELWPVAQTAGFAAPGPSLAWRHSSRAYRLDSAVLRAAIPLVAAVGLTAAGQLAFAPLALLLAPVLAVTRWLALSHAAHAFDARQLFARIGWLAPQLDIAPRIKLQSVEFACGPWARRRGYGTARLGIAGGTVTIPGMTRAHYETLRDALVASMEEADFSQVDALHEARQRMDHAA